MDLSAAEKALYQQGYRYIACIDEVGRGCLCGPVTAAAVILPEGLLLEEVNDSKKLSPKKRERLYDVIEREAVAIGIGEVSHEEIDRINIKNATKKAMLLAIENLQTPLGEKVVPDYLLIDAETLETGLPQEGIIQGDSKVQGIAAASIMAKVTRDRQLVVLSEKYPGYGFEKHKGYGTKFHREALLKSGPTPIHRRSFLKKILQPKPAAGERYEF